MQIELDDLRQLKVPTGQWVLIAKIPFRCPDKASQNIQQGLREATGGLANPPHNILILREGIELEVASHE